MSRLFSRRSAAKVAAPTALTVPAMPIVASALQTVSRTHYCVTGSWYTNVVYTETAAILRARGHRVITPTLPGHGLLHPPRPNAPGEPGLTYDEIVSPLEAEMVNAGLSELHGLGWSFGAAVLMQLYQRQPQRFRSLTIFDGFILAQGSSLLDDLMALVPADRTDFLTTFQGLINQDSDTIMLTPDFLREQFMPDADAELLARTFATLRPEPLGPLREAPDVARFWGLMADIAAYHAESHPMLPVPPRVTYLYAPEDDKLGTAFWFLSPDRLLAAGVPLIELTLRKGGHAAMVTQPEMFAEAVLAASDPAGPAALWSPSSAYTMGRPAVSTIAAPAALATSHHQPPPAATGHH